MIKEVQRLTIQPGEVLVFKVNGKVSNEQIVRIRSSLEQLIGDGHKILILDDQADLMVIPAPN